MASHNPNVSEWYTDKNIFITGATGFIGKVLLEKLLRSCPNIGKLYLLIRPKKSQDCHQRIEEISQSPVRFCFCFPNSKYMYLFYIKLTHMTNSFVSKPPSYDFIIVAVDNHNSM